MLFNACVVLFFQHQMSSHAWLKLPATTSTKLIKMVSMIVDIA